MDSIPIRRRLPACAAARMAMRLAALAAGVAAGAAVGAACADPDGAPASQPHNTGSGESAADAGIAATIRSRLMGEESLRSADISVTTRDGMVTLDGTVRSADGRIAAEAAARSVDGVRHVTNRLRGPAMSGNAPAAAPAAPAAVRHQDLLRAGGAGQVTGSARA